MTDTLDLIRRARELAASYELYGPFAASQLALMLTRVTRELERLHEENVQLAAYSQFLRRNAVLLRIPPKEGEQP